VGGVDVSKIPKIAVTRRFTKEQLRESLQQQLEGHEQSGVPPFGSADMISNWLVGIIGLEIEHLKHLPVESKGEKTLGVDCCGDRYQVLTTACCPHCRGCFCESCYARHCKQIVELLCGLPLRKD
jgi:hypothetical protein